MRVVQQLARLQDGLLDSADQLTACWASDDEECGGLGGHAQATAAGTALARVDAALKLVGGYDWPPATARSEVDALRLSRTGNPGAYDIAVAGGDPVAVEGCAERFEDLGTRGELLGDQAWRNSRPLEGRIRSSMQLTWGWSGAADSLAVAVGVDRLVMDHPLAATGPPRSLERDPDRFPDCGCADVGDAEHGVPARGLPGCTRKLSSAIPYSARPSVPSSPPARTTPACWRQLKSSTDQPGPDGRCHSHCERLRGDSPADSRGRQVRHRRRLLRRQRQLIARMKTSPGLQQVAKLIGWIDDASLITEQGRISAPRSGHGVRFAIEAEMA